MSTMIQEGQQLPMDSSFQVLRNGRPQDISTRELFQGKKVVLTCVAGAFNPVCHNEHVPGFVNRCDDFKKLGVDTVAVCSVNDAFVMDAWQQQVDPDRKLLFLADGNAANARTFGTDVDTGTFGGIRTRMLAAYIDNGVVKKFLVEKGDNVLEWTGEVSADNLLSQMPEKRSKN